MFFFIPNRTKIIEFKDIKWGNVGHCGGESECAKFL
jgi:hypothetical protein